MKRAPQPAALRCGFKPPKRQVGTTVRAVSVQQNPGTRGVLEQHQALPEQGHCLDQTLRHAGIKLGIELIDPCCGLPVLAQQLSAGCARCDAGELFVLFGVHGILQGQEALRCESQSTAAVNDQLAAAHRQGYAVRHERGQIRQPEQVAGNHQRHGPAAGFPLDGREC